MWRRQAPGLMNRGAARRCRRADGWRARRGRVPASRATSDGWPLRNGFRRRLFRSGTDRAGPAPASGATSGVGESAAAARYSFRKLLGGMRAETVEQRAFAIGGLLRRAFRGGLRRGARIRQRAHQTGHVAQRARLLATFFERTRGLAFEVDQIRVALRDQHLTQMEVAVNASAQRARVGGHQFVDGVDQCRATVDQALRQRLGSGRSSARCAARADRARWRASPACRRPMPSPARRWRVRARRPGRRSARRAPRAIRPAACR